ncbi:MAG: DUF2800 domain-containing protein [Azonexus sp.]
MTERFSASVASKHMSCHASANLDLAIPHWTPPEEDPSADNAANRGTEMHRMFADVMSLPTADIRRMAEAIAYVAAIKSRRRFKSLIEEVVQATWLKSGPNTCADLVLFVSDEIHVFDLKTGKIPVSAVENEQLLYYAVTYGALAPKAAGVHLHIVQPWADNIETWFADTARLQKFMADAQMAEAHILGGSTTFSPGDHCKFCPANPHGRGAKGKPYCPAMMGLLYPKTPVNYEEMLEEM